jgi:Bacteriophage tail sheath protein
LIFRFKTREKGELNMLVQGSYPGVYIEELPSGSHTITGVPTAVTAFIGRAPKGPVDDPMIVTSLGDFEKFFGGVNFDYPLTYAVRDFFQNGGSEAIVIRRFKVKAAAASAANTGSANANANAASGSGASSASNKKGDK